MEDCLVMFSGGKDSTLATCNLVKGNYRCHLLSFNNGSVMHEEIFQHSSKRLINRFGDSVRWIGVRTTYAPFRRYLSYWHQIPLAELAALYPNVTMGQVTCLCCQIAMWTEAIAYCVAKDIHRLACGYKATDEFCTGSEQYRAIMSGIAEDFGITTLFPVVDEKDVETCLLHNAMFPTVYEPKCSLGGPASIRFEGACQKQLLDFVSTRLSTLIRDQIKKSSRILQVIEVSNESLVAMEYEVPDGSQGLY